MTRFTIGYGRMPLLRILQSADRYQILGVTRQEIKLFEGNRDAVDEIELAPGVPRTIEEALGAFRLARPKSRGSMDVEVDPVEWPS